MHPEVEALVAQLDEAASLLHKHSADHWAKWLERDAGLLRASDAEGLRHFLSAFGGMGSLGDFNLAVTSKQDDADAALNRSPDDRRFHELLVAAHASASRMLREEAGMYD